MRRPRARPSWTRSQAKKAADGMLRDLGAAFYATKTGRSTPTTDADIEQLVTALQAHESEHGQITLAPESAGGRPDGSAGRRRLGGARPAATAPKAADPLLPAAPAADGADAVGRAAAGRRCAGVGGLTSGGDARDRRPSRPRPWRAPGTCRMSSSPRGGAVW